MQLITAIIKPHVLDAVKDGLKTKGIQGLTVTEVKGFGRQGGHTETYRGTEYAIEFVPKIKLQLVCDDADVDSLVDVIADVAKTGTIGDGKIWTTPVGRLVRIRTGEEGSDAI
jgi:nitrogen regulatory protein P-II 1